MSTTEQQQEDKTPGRFCWHEIVTDDAQGSKQFYGELLGWTFEEMDMGEMKYTMIQNGAETVGGMVSIDDNMQGVPPHILTYIAVEDIGAAVEKAQSLGARVCKAVTELPVGKFAILTDPTGAGFAFWEFGEPCQ